MILFQPATATNVVGMGSALGANLVQAVLELYRRSFR